VSAKQLLKKKGVDYQEILVDGNREEMQEMLSRSGGARTVPQIFIGDVHVGGRNELYALEQAGKLDALLEN
jgi:glutaredoxin 3